jgi:outer membrane protein, multidrug efflux system
MNIRSYSRLATLAVIASAVLLGGCASLSGDGNVADIQNLTNGKTAGVSANLAIRDTAATRTQVDELLTAPLLTADNAVRIALLNNPGLHSSMAQLGVSDAERVQAASLPNPHFSIGRFVAGDVLEIERAIGFNVLGILSLPWRAQWQNQQHEMAKLQAAQDVIALAADTRKAWVRAVAAAQTARYMHDAKEAAEAGGELARRMARVGNWSKFNQAREQLVLAEATAMLARAQQAAVTEREKLTRLLGLWGAQTQFRLPEQLPGIPKTPQELDNIEAQALRERLDVRASLAHSRYLGESLGLEKAAGYLSELQATYQRTTETDRAHGDKEVQRGWELELPIPIFDWGRARSGKAQALFMQSVAQVRQSAINARSEAREAYLGYRTAYDLAVHYRDEVVPLRKFISDETLLRYNGMLVGVFDLLGDIRNQISAVVSSIDAQRDFWLLDTDLQTALTGTSPGAIAGLKATGNAAAAESKGH